ncbi:TetR/AcrR family transcriptional regulator [Glycomyces sp. TRM65418]|uniref:TetR/AcrR family transcriptional regulator n=1 Tax=Glycomyces sp. TRM65418 TaxID=2867006 RepID=UPI001CE57AE3|nr:TetR family transcriptional regulator [Glycomyces sp. TRM65418]MCC3765643.1 TetR/AcrR family transcriptional regulator [Glycomyces sp. TRM65418]QZD55241.1 TetR/AcrR family transcriptional regulator [Glycomyces sp. TRM65418]
MSGTTTRSSRAEATREALLDAAERLFAEHGVAAVSARQISEAAGQGNNTAVGYHFGSKTDVVRAIVHRHTASIERLRTERVESIGDSPGLREWVECFIFPVVDHLGALGDPTWFARFTAQVLTDPALRPILEDGDLKSPSLQRIRAGVDECLVHLPRAVRQERDQMVRELMVVAPAVREVSLASGLRTARDSWHDAGAGMVDAVVGLFLAEVTEPKHRRPEQERQARQ